MEPRGIVHNGCVTVAYTWPDEIKEVLPETLF